MAQGFKRIAITGRFKKISTIESLKDLIALLSQQDVELIIEAQTAELLGHCPWPQALCSELAQQADLIIVVGGDGSLLECSHTASDAGVPVLGINRGRLGFLTDISPDEMSTQICAILQGEYQIEERLLLQAGIVTEDQTPTAYHDALNDVVLYAGSIARMIEFEVYINAQFVYSLRADGLIIATPTGSTAYALSAGGPILHSALSAFVITPVAPHTLTSRPIVVQSDAVVDLVVSSVSALHPKFSCDGKTLMTLEPGDKLRVQRKAQTLQLIHPLNYDYYHVLRQKLRWGTQLEGPNHNT